METALRQDISLLIGTIVASLTQRHGINKWSGTAIGRIVKEIAYMISSHEGKTEIDDYTGNYGMFRKLLIGNGVAISVSHNGDCVSLYEFTPKSDLTEENYKTIYDETSLNCGITYEEWRHLAKNDCDCVTNDMIWNWGNVINHNIAIFPDGTLKEYDKAILIH